MKSSELLERAADLIREKGWIQGEWKTDEGFCASGALMELQLSPVDRMKARIFLHQVIPIAASIVGWNDAHGRTKEEVLQAFEAAAKLAKEEGD